MKTLMIFISFILILYLGFCGYFFVKQKKYIFFPSRISSQPPKYLVIKDVFIPTTDRELLHGWWLETENASNTVLFFHGNVGNLSSRTTKLETFKRLNLNALIIDYRGYGKSSGEIKKENNIYTDAEAAWNYLLNNKKILPENIIIWGRSLGTAPAAYIAQGQNIKSLILESPFSSLADILKHQFPILPVKTLLQFKFNTKDFIGSVMAPILIIYANNDKIVPPKQAEALAKFIPGQKKLIILQGGHNDFVSLSYEKYLQILESFLK